MLVLDPPTIHELVASLPLNARLGSSLQRHIQQALEDEKQHPADDDGNNKGRKCKAEETTAPESAKKLKSSTPLKLQVGGHLRIGWSIAWDICKHLSDATSGLMDCAIRWMQNSSISKGRQLGWRKLGSRRRRGMCHFSRWDYSSQS
ncbi:expressed unknown protein [Seminavis robusta]|uniref:Uncharacterized protein n=1 Tax=Seminavis robusta TaxID=568900 RepID=A0A9N8HGX5_9STRA|nr:expressed unknown protein [Seminavis robusta]|eukprot:Sro508_g156720.1 n/a (147) ;mRNA; f:24069-24509